MKLPKNIKEKRGVFRDDVTHIMEKVTKCLYDEIERTLNLYIKKFNLRDFHQIDIFEDELMNAVIDGLKSNFFWQQLIIKSRGK